MTIYKLVSADEWRAAEAIGVFNGSALDVRDGFIHFSTAEQVRETAVRYFAGRQDLLLVAIDVEALPMPISWEPSRGGALFPHLYAPLPLAAVQSVHPLALDSTGAHIFTTVVG